MVLTASQRMEAPPLRRPRSALGSTASLAMRSRDAEPTLAQTAQAAQQQIVERLGHRDYKENS